MLAFGLKTEPFCRQPWNIQFKKIEFRLIVEQQLVECEDEIDLIHDT